MKRIIKPLCFKDVYSSMAHVPLACLCGVVFPVIVFARKKQAKKE